MSSLGEARLCEVRQSWLSKARCVLTWQCVVRYGSRGAFGQGVVGHCTVWRVVVRQSCLGTVRRGAVKFGEARQSRRCKLWRGGFWRALAGLGSLGLARSVLERRRGVSSGSHGLLRLVMASLVKTRLGKAVKVLRGMSRLSEERLVRARLSKAVGVWHVEARCSMSRQIVE